MTTNSDFIRQYPLISAPISFEIFPNTCPRIFLNYLAVCDKFAISGNWEPFLTFDNDLAKQTISYQALSF